jgi:hypothetical protein
VGASLEHPQLSIERQEATFLKTKRNRVRTIRLRHPACPGGVGTEVGTPRHNRSNYVFWHGEGARYHNVASRLRAAIKALVEHKDPAQRAKRFRVHDLRRRRSHRRAGGLRDGGALMRVILENLDAADLGPVTVIGRDAWALVELHRAGEAGYTPMTHPGLGRHNG